MTTLRFEEAARLALEAQEPATRLSQAHLACALWPASATDRLEDLYLDLVELRVEVLLHYGQLAAAIRLVTPAAAAHPDREPLWTLLARAQRACGRYAEADATLATFRTRITRADGGSVTRGLRPAS